jgi:murein DD-endopeptidase MepM/ murein hydrolase activator NlpD
MREHPIEKKQKMHKGVDWAAPKDTPVLSMFDGTVTYAGKQQGKAGYVVKIKDTSGRESKFFHLQPGSIAVKTGQKVTAGQHVAGVGKSGSATGYHLHAELWVGNQAVDLESYLGGHEHG